MENFETFTSQYDLYLSFLSKKIDALEQRLNKISPTDYEREYVKSLPSSIEIIPDGLSEFYSGWGKRDYDSRGNPFRPMILDRVAEIRFELNRSKNRMFEIELYSELPLKIAFFLDHSMITPVSHEQNGVYKLSCVIPKQMHGSVVSFILVCPPSEREFYKDKGIVFVGARAS